MAPRRRRAVCSRGSIQDPQGHACREETGLHSWYHNIGLVGDQLLPLVADVDPAGAHEGEVGILVQSLQQKGENTGTWKSLAPPQKAEPVHPDVMPTCCELAQAFK